MSEYPTPLYEKILMRPADPKLSKGGLHLLPPGPHSKIELRKGIVIAVGIGGERMDGQVETRPHICRVGDEVLYAWSGAVPLRFDHDDGHVEELMLTTVDHIYAILHRPDAVPDTERPKEVA
jgi:co-chaperonin GroES (HSP10)